MPLMASATTDSSGSASETTVTSETAAAVEEENVVNNTVVAAGGRTIKSTLVGAYRAKTVQGFAVNTPAATVNAAAGLAEGSVPFVSNYDIYPETSPLAYASLNGAANAIGGKVLAAINLQFGWSDGTSYNDLGRGVTASATVGVPLDKYTAGKNYAMIVVFPGGATQVLLDQDTDPYTVTFNLIGGFAAYALVEY